MVSVVVFAASVKGDGSAGVLGNSLSHFLQFAAEVSVVQLLILAREDFAQNQIVQCLWRKRDGVNDGVLVIVDQMTRGKGHGIGRGCIAQNGRAVNALRSIVDARSLGKGVDLMIVELPSGCQLRIEQRLCQGGIVNCFNDCFAGGGGFADSGWLCNGHLLRRLSLLLHSSSRGWAV